MKRLALAVLAALSLAPPAQARNLIVFVADGLRYGSVEPGNMPNMARLKAQGVDFTNSHSLYPTVTTVNASVIATGHYVGDTGDFGNTLYVATPMAALKGSTIAFLENDALLAEMDRKFGGNYLGETSLIAAARANGFQTAIIGKEGPSRVQDVTAAPDGSQTVILDDASGHEGGLGLPAWFTARMKTAFMDDATPKPSVPDIEQEADEMKAATRIVLPHFRESGKPFVMLFWSRDPDMSQHFARDSLGELVPGINGPSALAGARNADSEFGALMAYLKSSGLDKDTDVFVTADHGFTTVDHAASATSPSLKFASDGAPPGALKSGFLAVDLAATLGLPLRAPDVAAPVDFAHGGELPGGSGLLGQDPAQPQIVVAANGGSDLVYLPGPDAKALAARIVTFLQTQDYVSGLFVNERLGKFPGALAMGDVGLIGDARTPHPDIYVNFRSFSTGCENPLQCTAEVADTSLATGQGNHGSFSRAETRNFMAAAGPDFKAGFADPAPISNADIAPTLAHILGLEIAPRGKLTGRVIGEALTGGAPAVSGRKVVVSEPGPGGVRTILDEQTVGQTRYFDAAGFAGKTVGLETPAK